MTEFMRWNKCSRACSTVFIDSSSFCVNFYRFTRLMTFVINTNNRILPFSIRIREKTRSIQEQLLKAFVLQKYFFRLRKLYVLHIFFQRMAFHLLEALKWLRKHCIYSISYAGDCSDEQWQTEDKSELLCWKRFDAAIHECARLTTTQARNENRKKDFEINLTTKNSMRMQGRKEKENYVGGSSSAAVFLAIFYFPWFFFLQVMTTCDCISTASFWTFSPSLLPQFVVFQLQN